MSYWEQENKENYEAQVYSMVDIPIPLYKDMKTELLSFLDSF
jgi:hypothetical protein